VPGVHLDERPHRHEAKEIAMNRYSTLILGLAGLATTLAPAAPAAAAPIERGEIHGVFPGVIDDFCDVPGLTVTFEAVVDGTYSVKSHGPDGLLFYAEHGSFVLTTRNPASGMAVVEKTHFLDRDLHVIDNGDGTLTIHFFVTGVSTLFGPDGKAIARNPGQVRFEVVVDHGDTPTDPSDDVELSFNQIKGSTGRTDDYCIAIIDAIG
jgi:hypothetical protein